MSNTHILAFPCFGGCALSPPSPDSVHGVRQVAAGNFFSLSAVGEWFEFAPAGSQEAGESKRESEEDE